MVKLGEVHKSVLEKYARPVVHMRRQVESRRFGLVFGAGLSKAFELPTWAELVEMIAVDPDVDGKKVLEGIPPRAGLPYLTEMLFEHFKRRRYNETDPKEHNTRSLDFRIGARWQEIIRKHLYSAVKNDINSAIKSHPYIEQYLPLIQQSHMTVTYNFDDFIEQALMEARGEEGSSRGFESVTNPWTQFRRTEAIIYHPNGVVPENVLEMPSDRLVFSEASYAEQLMGIFAGDHAGLLNHLSKHTCLFIGLSLDDETLRSALMQAARSCPGNFHYYVSYVRKGEKIDPDKMHAIRQANFKVYNLVTLFMGDEEIRAMGELIDIERCKSEEFCDFACQHSIPVRYRFYVTGAVGVGKSTTINQFRNLHVLDEWLEERLPLLAKDWESLTNGEKETVDSWIIGQFKKKNDKLRNLREGIFMMDRGPLDPLSFTPDGEWSNKAHRMLSQLCPGQADWKVEDGRVILLEGDPSELALRVIVSERKDYTDDKLKKLEERLGVAYGENGMIRCDTKGLVPSDVAKRVAEIVHLEEYNPVCDLHNRFENILKEGFNAIK